MTPDLLTALQNLAGAAAPGTIPAQVPAPVQPTAPVQSATVPAPIPATVSVPVAPQQALLDQTPAIAQPVAQDPAFVTPPGIAAAIDPAALTLPPGVTDTTLVAAGLQPDVVAGQPMITTPAPDTKTKTPRKGKMPTIHDLVIGCAQGGLTIKDAQEYIRLWGSL